MTINEELSERFGGQIITSKQLHDFWKEKNLLSHRVITEQDLSHLKYDSSFKKIFIGCTITFVSCEDEGRGDEACIGYLEEYGACTSQGETKQECFDELFFILHDIYTSFSDEKQHFLIIELLKTYETEMKQDQRTAHEVIIDLCKKFTVFKNDL